jgi:hypothetical protein
MIFCRQQSNVRFATRSGHIAIKWQHIGHAHAITSSKQLGIIGDRAIEDQAMIVHPRDAFARHFAKKCFDRRR